MAIEPSLIIIEDTNEQKPLNFSRFKNVASEQAQKIFIGNTRFSCDYNCVINDGSLSSMAFERKSKADLWGTMGQKYEGFKRKMNACIEHGIRMILIIECSIDEISKGHSYNSGGGRMKRSMKSGNAMCKQLETLRVKHGLETVYCSGRTDMKRYMYERWMAEARLELKNGN